MAKTDKTLWVCVFAVQLLLIAGLAWVAFSQALESRVSVRSLEEFSKAAELVRSGERRLSLHEQAALIDDARELKVKIGNTFDTLRKVLLNVVGLIILCVILEVVFLVRLSKGPRARRGST